MGSQSKVQPYPYSLKTVAANDFPNVCFNRVVMYMTPPKDALTIERLFCHIVFRFEAGVAAGSRYLRSIGIIDELVPLLTEPSNYQRRQEVNIAADANRRIDLSIDLSHLLKNDDVAYSAGGADVGPDTGYTAVELVFDPSLESTPDIGDIELWKIDGLFTTIGIR